MLFRAQADAPEGSFAKSGEARREPVIGCERRARQQPRAALLWAEASLLKEPSVLLHLVVDARPIIWLAAVLEEAGWAVPAKP